MSAKATAYVWEHSPHTGATFIVHLALADVANDQHENELWMSLAAIAKKARCSRSTAQASLKELCGTSHLVLLKAGKQNHQPGRYWMRTVPEIEQSDLGARTVRSEAETVPEIGRVTKENTTNSSGTKVSELPKSPPPWRGSGKSPLEFVKETA